MGGFLLAANIAKADGVDHDTVDLIELRRWSTDDMITIHVGKERLTVDKTVLREAVDKVAYDD